MDEEKRRPGCLRRSCGCLLGVLALIVATIVVLLVVGIATRPGAEARRTSVAAEVPPAAPAARGVIAIDVEVGVLRIEPAAAGEPPSATAEHDEETSELTSRFVTEPDGSWRWDVRMAPTRGMVALALGGQREPGTVVVRIPRDLAADLEVTASKGMGDLQLGGLALGSVDVDAELGEWRVRFDEPTREPLAFYALRGKMGQARTDGLANASPERVDVHWRLGELAVDLGGGTWRGPSVVSVDFRFGEARLRAPSDLPLVVDRLEMAQGSVSGDPLPAASGVEAPAGAIRLSVRGGMGELRTERP